MCHKGEYYEEWSTSDARSEGVSYEEYDHVRSVEDYGDTNENLGILDWD